MFVAMPPTKQRARRTGKQKNPMVVKREPKGVNRRDQPRLLDVLEWTEWELDADGNPIADRPIDGITVGDRIIDSVRRNLGVAEACAAAGVTHQFIYYRWLEQGAKVAQERAAMAAGTVQNRKLSATDSAVWWFYQGIEQAKAEAERRLVLAIDQRGTGDDLVQSTETRQLERVNGQMVEVKRTVKKNRVLPDSASAQWLLARKHPEKWGGTGTLEVMGGGEPGRATIEHHHTHSVPALEDMLAKVAAKIEGRPTQQTQADDDLGHIPPLTPDVQPAIEASAVEVAPDT
jgi:hypothetical protein